MIVQENLEKKSCLKGSNGLLKTLVMDAHYSCLYVFF